MGSFQLNEILLTAAQSLLAVVLLLSLRLDIKGALLLFVLFIGQFIPLSLFANLSGIMPWMAELEGMHFGFVGLYLFFSLYLLVRHRKVVVTEWRGIKVDRPHELAALWPWQNRTYQLAGHRKVAAAPALTTDVENHPQKP